MGDRWSKRKRCDLCQTKTELFAYDGFMVCRKCKGSLRASDNCGGRPSNEPRSAPKVVQGCFSRHIPAK